MFQIMPSDKQSYKQTNTFPRVMDADSKRDGYSVANVVITLEARSISRAGRKFDRQTAELKTAPAAENCIKITDYK